jgi:hypothetical protein
MRILHVAFGVTILLIGGAAAAPAKQPPTIATPAICTTLKNLVDEDQKEISAQTVDELTENSAPRATVQEAKINVGLLEIQANLLLMNQHRCAPYDAPISTTEYLGAASRCETERLQNFTAGQTTTPDSCKRENWSRLY